MNSLLIVDDHPIVRKGLRKILSENPNSPKIDEVNNGDELFEAVERKHYDLILLDISLPGKNGLELLKELKKDYPKIPVLVLSVYSIEKYAIEAIKLGAAGYLPKSSAPKELINAVNQINERGKYISPQLAEKILLDIDRISSPSNSLHSILSAREMEVFKLIAQGKRVKDIAAKLDINVKTVSTYKERIFQKMKFNSNADLIRYAVREKLII